MSAGWPEDAERAVIGALTNRLEQNKPTAASVVLRDAADRYRVLHDSVSYADAWTEIALAVRRLEERGDIRAPMEPGTSWTLLRK